MKAAIELFVMAVLANSSPCFAAIYLDFNSPAAGPINDANGIGTGFTTRLAGTGSAIAANDPNMDLLASPGRLLLTSSHSNLGGLALPSDNLSTAEAPGFFVAGVGLNDIQIIGAFRNIHVPNGSDQISVYAAIDGTKNVRAGVHELNAFVLSVNDGGGDVNIVSPLGIFSTGDDIDVSLSRESGLWQMSWHNLTNATTGSLPPISIAWLDAQPNLYMGIHAANAGKTHSNEIQSFIAEIDSFSINVAPEPTSLTLWGILVTVVTATGLRKRGYK